MSNRILDSQIQSRNDTAANWSSVNPVLLKGEIGIEIDTRKMKVGDGTTEWNSLKYLKDDIVIASANPTTGDKDFDLGEFWLNQTDKTLYVLVAKTESAGEWKRIPNAEELVIVSEALVAQKLKCEHYACAEKHRRKRRNVHKSNGQRKGIDYENRTSYGGGYPDTHACEDLRCRNGSIERCGNFSR